MRRNRLGETKSCAFGPFVLDVQARKLTRRGKEVELTPKEDAVLELLVHRAGRAMRRDEILRAVWGYGVFVNGRSVDRCINTLRGKIEEDPAEPVWIKTVREVGYRFEATE